KDRDAAMDHLEAFEDRTSTLMRGDEKKTKISIRVGDAFQVDMRLVEDQQFGAALQYFTGSQQHNIHVRSIAKKRDLLVNEYGVFPIDCDDHNDPVNSLSAGDEAGVYDALGLPWIPPELREDRLEFSMIQSDADDRFDTLLQLADIKGDLHMHTTATDGQNTIREMADAAIQCGLQYIAITDHSQRVSMANGLDPERALQQWEMIDEIRDEYAGRLVILKGIECDILEKGGMDLPDKCLAMADWVLASIHYGQKQSRQQITDRITGALQNPHVSCVAHPTGRLINRRPAYDVDMDAILDAASQHGKFVELNANPARLDLNELHLTMAKRRGIPIVINTDAHSTIGMGVMRYGVNIARRAAVTADEVANTLDAKAFCERIGVQV
ncbi:MAG: DNA polymerase/3'-5' exonuclease PolX, partial [Planctomycetota bacterium]